MKGNELTKIRIRESLLFGNTLNHPVGVVMIPSQASNPGASKPN